MSKEKVEVMVEGGKATAAPPLGPALGPLGVSITNVIEEINKKTKDLAGMKVPVTVIVDTSTKEFDIKVGSPPVSALIKKELGIEKGSSEAGKSRAGDLTEEQVKKIASAKFGSTEDRFITMVKGSARSMGITIGQGAVSEEEKKAAEESKKKAAEEAAAAAAPKEGEEVAEGEGGEEASTEEDGEAPKEEEKKEDKE
ncbi:MAG: 50S ribosomal protein L11 [Candidatus Aenigmarchaeota archaeon]|nr:50S ribosomal protein L11 [Candidatus Aenigmarchaeota archaeon]